MTLVDRFDASQKSLLYVNATWRNIPWSKVVFPKEKEGSTHGQVQHTSRSTDEWQLWSGNKHHQGCHRHCNQSAFWPAQLLAIISDIPLIRGIIDIRRPRGGVVFRVVVFAIVKERHLSMIHAAERNIDLSGLVKVVD